MSLSHGTLKALHEAATPGPWGATANLPGQECPGIEGHGETIVVYGWRDDDEGVLGPPENAELITYLRNAVPEILTLIAERDAGLEPRPFSEWSEDYRDVLWHLMPIHEPPFCGTPLGSDWPYFDGDESRLWWTPLPDCNEINTRWEARAALGGNHHGS